MEVMVGSSFGIGMAAAYVRDRAGVSAQDKSVPAALFMADESGRGGSQIGLASRIELRMNSKSPEEFSEDSSSSIGGSSEDEEEEDDAVSFQGGRTLDSFSSSLEDSLPIKRGLSNHYVGKSKSFGNLMEASNSNAKDLEKTENPFNKRRRLIIANKLRRRSMSVSHFYTWQNPSSMPLLALQELNGDDHNDYKDGNDDDDDDKTQTITLFEKRKIMMMMKNKRDLMAQTQSCFCLSSLQEEDDDDDNE